MPKNRIFNEFPVAVLIQEEEWQAAPVKLNIQTAWMMEKSVIAFCEQYTKNASTKQTSECCKQCIRTVYITMMH